MDDIYEIELTPYQQEKFSHLDTIPIGKSYKYNPDRPDRKEFEECLELYSETWYDCLEICKENCTFKRVPAVGTKEWCKERGYKHWTETIDLFYK